MIFLLYFIFQRKLSAFLCIWVMVNPNPKNVIYLQPNCCTIAHCVASFKIRKGLCMVKVVILLKHRKMMHARCFQSKKRSLVYIKKSSLDVGCRLCQIARKQIYFKYSQSDCISMKQCILVKMHFYFIKFDLSWDTNSDAKCLWFLKYFSLNLNALNDDISSITTILPADKYFSGIQNKIIFFYYVYFL